MHSSIPQLLNHSQTFSGHPVRGLKVAILSTSQLPRLDYKLRNDYDIFCFPQALNPPPPRSISIKFSIKDLDRSQVLRNFQSFFKAVHSPWQTTKTAHAPAIEVFLCPNSKYYLSFLAR